MGSDSEAREQAMRQELGRSGVLRPDGGHWWWLRTETGHRAGVFIHPGSGAWHAQFSHAADPEQTTVDLHLGHNDHDVVRHLRSDMAQPDVMGEMRAQYKRALGNGDPTGDHPEARREEPDQGIEWVIPFDYREGGDYHGRHPMS
jgi:hypothetical protein